METPIIEGSCRERDISYKFITEHTELSELEAGIPYREFFFHSKARDKELEFRVLKRITETRKHAECLVENSAMTCSMNRYADILPYKDTLVHIPGYSYINANFVDGACAGSEQLIIATQGPLRRTMEAFWAMVWEYEVSLVIMMCNLLEEGVVKCEEYFPSENNISCDVFEISLVKSTIKYPNLTERVFIITHTPTQENRIITHLQSTAWPDQGVPPLSEEFSSINYMISMIKKKWLANRSKVLVHCSAGIGRTGVLIGIFNVVTALEELLEKEAEDETTEPRVSIFGVVRRLREQRWGMVATVKQYKFIYKFMEYWITSFLSHQQQIGQ
ncbi:unnamed protein product [Blepharisma stoltei]|uniref:Protein tyrosine phosphatase n=1 Tax=Blepharisma stoltei TaxID=1481888 RepID=A0AAU9JFC8_9CILI|nr:unnamed protein product [Blepharisma stoltei]